MREGWPILAAGDLSSLDRVLSPGHYRVVVLPVAVDARVTARLARTEPEAVRQGGTGRIRSCSTTGSASSGANHRARRSAPSRPVEFALAGAAHVTLDISDRMIAELRRIDDAAGAVLARPVYKSGFAGELPTGRYRVGGQPGRNDRLDYTISLHSDELQPDGRARSPCPRRCRSRLPATGSSA
jgi:hypothetical protein